jgi:hypothetical protein
MNIGAQCDLGTGEYRVWRPKATPIILRLFLHRHGIIIFIHFVLFMLACRGLFFYAYCHWLLASFTPAPSVGDVDPSTVIAR